MGLDAASAETFCVICPVRDPSAHRKSASVVAEPFLAARIACWRTAVLLPDIIFLLLLLWEAPNIAIHCTRSRERQVGVLIHLSHVGCLNLPVGRVVLDDAQRVDPDVADA